MKLRPNQLLIILVILKLALPYILQSFSYEPHRDEFLYLEQGHHMAWGYMEVPPVLSVFAWLTHAFGDGMFWIKLWPSLFGAATFIVAGRIVLSLGGKGFALLLLFLPFIFGVYLRLFFLFQPNSPEVFFWTMIAFSIISFIQTGKNKWLYIFGLSIGFGLLSKYSVAFFLVSVLIGLLLSKYRVIFFNKNFWYSMLLGFAIFLPNIFWQYERNFPVIHHMEELQETQLQFISPFVFLKDQLLMNLPCFFIWIAGLLYISFSNKEKRFRFLGWTYVVVIILFLVSHGKNYYTLGIYPVLFAFGAYRLEQLTMQKRKSLRYAFILFPVILGILMLPIALPVFPPKQLASFYEKMGTKKTGALKWEDLKDHPLPQDFSDMLGWKTIAEKTARLYNSLSPEEKNKTIIKCDNYGLCGALNFYGKHMGLPEAYCYNGSFLLWMPDTFNITNVITIGENFPDTTRNIVKNFENVSLKDELKDSFAREDGTEIILWYHCNASVLSKFLEDEVRQRKKKFTR